MQTNSPWPIIGFNNREIRTSYYKINENNSSLAVLFPGFSYSTEAPLFFFLEEFLIRFGIDILAIEYRYNEWPAFQTALGDEQDKWFAADVSMMMGSILANALAYKKIIFIGKSLGTTALLQVLNTVQNPERYAYIWITPGTSNSKIAESLEKDQHPSLIIGGTADHFFLLPEFRALEKLNPCITVQAIEGAGHMLEQANDMARSIDNIKLFLAYIEGFLTRIVGLKAIAAD